MRLKIISVVTASLLSLLTTFMVPSLATASTSNAHTDFPSQARAAGLTPAQAPWLQAKADRYLAMMGGTQVAPNKIDLNGRGLVSIALAGEQSPRNLSSASALETVTDHCLGGANPGYFCAYSRTYGSGDSIAMVDCEEYVLHGWTGRGSWDNNQTRGTQARMFGRSGRTIYTTVGAPSNMDSGFDWTTIWGVSPC